MWRKIPVHGCCSLRVMTGLLAVAIASQGCDSYHTLTVKERNLLQEPQRIFRLELKDHSFVEFATDSSGYGTLRDSEIVGVLENGVVQTVRLNEIQRIYTKGPSTAATIGNLTFVGIVAAIVLSGILGRHGGWGIGPSFAGPWF